MTCFDPRPGDIYIVWECSRKEDDVRFDVLIYGKNADQLAYIDAAVTRRVGSKDNASAILFLSEIAAIPLVSEALAAREWVAQTLPSITGNNDEKINAFEGLTYTLGGFPHDRLLSIRFDQ